MTFCSKEQNKDEIIEDVEKYNNCVGIYYLNGIRKDFCFNETFTLEHLEEKMLEQAREREKLEYFNTYVHKYGSLIIWLASNTLLIQNTNASTLLLTCLALVSIVFFANYVDNKSKVKELKKYRILIKNYKEIKEKINVEELFDFNNENVISLDIFNIDSYTLDEIKLVKKELKKLK